MHMADALVSPVVGGGLWATSAVATAYSARRVTDSLGDDRVPLMGVLGAFVFAAQMINFTIPGTGSSGHLGGGLLLAVLLGPHAALIVLASVLTVQALLFADGGLLALGCNITNMAVLPCLVCYPLIYRPIAGDGQSPARRAVAAMLAAIAGLQFGALGVVSETVLSGISELPFRSFALVMLPIHLAIGVVEGVVTVAALSFIARAQPDLVRTDAQRTPSRRLITVLALTALVIGGGLSWFASEHPDGLEWAVAKVSQGNVQPPESGYGSPGVSGIVGGLVTLGVIVIAAWSMRLRHSR